MALESQPTYTDFNKCRGAHKDRAEGRNVETRGDEGKGDSLVGIRNSLLDEEKALLHFWHLL